MNNKKPLNQLVEELKPEEYADFVACIKESFGTANCTNQAHYKMLKSILDDPENEAYFSTLSKGCQIAMMLYVEAFERQQIRAEEISDILGGLD